MSNKKDFADMDENERLEYAQLTRHDIVRCFTHDEDGTPTRMIGKEEGQLVRGLLKDMDSSIYTGRRLTVEAANAENDKAIARLAEDALARLPTVGRDKSRYEASDSKGPSVDDSALRKYDLTEGVVEPVGNDVDLDDIARKGREIFKGVKADED